MVAVPEFWAKAVGAREARAARERMEKIVGDIVVLEIWGEADWFGLWSG